MAQTQARTSRIAQAVTDAQRLANADGRTYLVTRPPRGERPLVEPLAGLEILGSFLVDAVDTGRALLVSPQGSHYGLSAAEIVAAERSAVR